MIKQFKKTIISLVMAISVITLFEQKTFAFNPIDLFSGDVDSFQEKKLKEKEDFLGFYYDLVKQEHFSSGYQNNLILSADVDYDFSRNGAILLGLIDYLEKDSNYTSKFLLKKLNSFFYLEMHSLISHVEIPQERRASLYKTMHALYKAKTVKTTEEVSPEREATVYPFRTLLSRTAISIHMALDSSERHNKQRETLVFALEQLKEQFLEVNQINSLVVENKVIDEFMTLLEAYAVQEDVVNKGSVQKALYITGFVLAVIVIVGYFAWPKIKEKVGEVVGAAASIAVGKLEDRIEPIARKGLSAVTEPEIRDPKEKRNPADKRKSMVKRATEEMVDTLRNKLDENTPMLKLKARELVREVRDEILGNGGEEHEAPQAQAKKTSKTKNKSTGAPKPQGVKKTTIQKETPVNNPVLPVPTPPQPKPVSLAVPTADDFA